MLLYIAALQDFFSIGWLQRVSTDVIDLAAGQ